jgi:2'-hydroxyisoflavone reductase
LSSRYVTPGWRLRQVLAPLSCRPLLALLDIQTTLKSMRILIVGGTAFVGRHIAKAALEAGHSVVLFHRSASRKSILPDAEHVFGDRTRGEDLQQLCGTRWDAVIDTCGYTPEAVGTAVRALTGCAPHYTFISSQSVYRDFNSIGMNEDSPLAETEDVKAPLTAENYGALKILAEREVRSVFPNHSFIVRCGIIVGPFDYLDRFNYWVRRIAEGGRVLCPGSPEQAVQFIDARDLGAKALRSIQCNRTR